MQSNTGKVVTPTRDFDPKSGMEDYDSLPLQFRVFLANCPYKYSAASVWDMIRKHGYDRAFRAMVQQKNAHSVREISAAYGPDHPQINPGRKT